MQKLKVILLLCLTVSLFFNPTLAQDDSSFQKKTGQFGLNCNTKYYLERNVPLLATVGVGIETSLQDNSLVGNINFAPLTYKDEKIPGMLIASSITYYPSFARWQLQKGKADLNFGLGAGLSRIQVEEDEQQFKEISDTIQQPELTSSLRFKVLEALSIETKAGLQTQGNLTLQVKLGVWF